MRRGLASFAASGENRKRAPSLLARGVCVLAAAMVSCEWQLHPSRIRKLTYCKSTPGVLCRIDSATSLVSSSELVPPRSERGQPVGGFRLKSLQQACNTSGKNARRRGGLVTGIRGPRRLYQQNMHLSARHRAMLNPLGHHEYLTLIEGDRAVPKLDVERSSEHKEEIVSVVVLVPVKWPLKLGDHDVVAVVGCNRTRGKAVSESRELLGKVGGGPHHGFSLRTALGNPVLDSLHVIRSRATFLDDQCRSELLIGAAMLRCSFRHEDTSTPRRSLSPTQ